MRLNTPKKYPTFLPVLLLLCPTLLLFVQLTARGTQGFEDAEHETIQYTKATPTDPIAQLQKAIDSGKVRLDFDAKNGYLRSVLKNLAISPTSQTLVFSKTSLQRERISPNAPRALYFNDQTYIGWIQESPLLEVSTTDPKLGGVFYLLEQRKAEKPRFIRQTYECLQCHSGSLTNNVPGHIMRSVYPRRDGQPEFRAGTFLTGDQSPYLDRWGGWYVTGQHGNLRHMGNAFARGGDDVTLNRSEGANLTDLSKLVDTSPYISPHSDMVALMVMGHQINTHNLITRANYHTRMAIHYEQMLNKELGRPLTARLDSTSSRIKSVCEPLLKALLFCNEEPIISKVSGTSGFAEQFAKSAPRDKQGRSLRQLDLERRLFRYPCSYLIYSPEFDALPAPAKEYLYPRLWAILENKETSPEFKHLSPADRTAIRDILLGTKPEFASAKPASL